MNDLTIGVRVERATARAPRCMGVAKVRSTFYDDKAHRFVRIITAEQCGNRTTDASGLCWRHR